MRDGKAGMLLHILFLITLLTKYTEGVNNNSKSSVLLDLHSKVQAAGTRDPKEIVRSLLEQEAQVRSTSQAQFANPTEWWPGRTEFRQADNELGSFIASGSGQTDELWWLKNAPWFLPPPPEWGPIKQEMYAGYYNKPVHRSFELPNVSGQPINPLIPNPLATDALTAPGPQSPQPYVAISRPDAFALTGTTLAQVARGKLPPVPVPPQSQDWVRAPSEDPRDEVNQQSKDALKAAPTSAAVVADTAAILNAQQLFTPLHQIQGLAGTAGQPITHMQMPMHGGGNTPASSVLPVQTLYPNSPELALSSPHPQHPGVVHPNSMSMPSMTPFTHPGNVLAPTPPQDIIANIPPPATSITAMPRAPPHVTLPPPVPSLLETSQQITSKHTAHTHMEPQEDTSGLLQPLPQVYTGVPDRNNPTPLMQQAIGATPAIGAAPSRPVGMGTDGVYLAPFRGDYGSRLLQPLHPQHLVGPSMHVKPPPSSVSPTAANLTPRYDVIGSTTQDVLNPYASPYVPSATNTDIDPEHEQGWNLYSNPRQEFTTRELLHGANTRFADPLAVPAPGGAHIAGAIHPNTDVASPPGSGQMQTGSSLFELVNNRGSGTQYTQHAGAKVDLQLGMPIHHDNGLNNLNNPNMVMHAPHHSPYVNNGCNPNTHTHEQCQPKAQQLVGDSATASYPYWQAPYLPNTAETPLT